VDASIVDAIPKSTSKVIHPDALRADTVAAVLSGMSTTTLLQPTFAGRGNDLGWLVSG